MATRNITTKIQMRQDTAANWESKNPILLSGEIGYDITYKKSKQGDGVTPWNSLPYMFVDIDEVLTIVAAKVGGLNATSWEDIVKIADKGAASKIFAIGDEKTITLTTSEEVTIIILGFNHDTKTSGGLANITFGMKNLIATKYPMNSSGTNAGGWNSSIMRTSTMQTLKSLLPTDLQTIIKPVNKKTSAGNQSSSIQTTSDSLFLLSEIEIFGINTNSKAGEGTQYKYYSDIANTAESRIKYLSNGAGAAEQYWERSPTGNNSTHFCTVTVGGSANAASALASYTRGVSFGFCI